eukprot:247251-Chlamydomonas_euryale.AAC.3
MAGVGNRQGGWLELARGKVDGWSWQEARWMAGVGWCRYVYMHVRVCACACIGTWHRGTRVGGGHRPDAEGTVVWAGSGCTDGTVVWAGIGCKKARSWGHRPGGYKARLWEQGQGAWKAAL